MYRLVYCVCIHLAHIGRVGPYWACTTCTPSHPAYIMKGHPPIRVCGVSHLSLPLYNTNHMPSLSVASQILSIMKPPSEARISQSSQSGQAHYSLASSEARIALDASCRRNSVINDSNRNFDGSWTSGMSHFATQLRASVKSCLNLQTIPRMNSVRAHQWGKSSRNSHPPHDHQTFR